MVDKRGYPTPDNEPDPMTYVCRPIWLPDNPEMIALVYGQMFETTKAAFWRQEGTMTPEQAAMFMAIASGMNDLEAECGLSCEDIIDCIENDPETATAIQNWLTDNGYGSPSQQGIGTPDYPSYWDSDPAWIDGGAGCDNDNLFGAITQVIDMINARVTDLFEVLEAESNIVERTQLAVSAFPPTDWLAADELAGFLDQLVEEIAEGYAAAFTEDLRNEYRCDLFCSVKDTCEMDFRTFASYFNDRIGATPPEDAFAEFIEWFITGSFVGTQIVDATYALICAALSYGSDVLGIKLASLAQSVNSALGSSDNTWETLCEECAPPPAVAPIIGIGSCSASLGATGGTNIVHQSSPSTNYWRIDSTHPASDNRVTIVRDGGGLFHVGNITSITGTINFYGWKLSGAACAAGASPPASSNNFEVFVITGSTAFTVQFEFTEAP